MVGDINSVHKPSYSESQLLTMTRAWPDINDVNDLPYDACDLITEAFKSPPVNEGQMYDSLFQKCVTHGWSTHHDSAYILFTDVTDLDHQPMILATASTASSAQEQPNDTELNPE